ncbi:MAG TPA: transposase [Candidatus Ozemobacteraceae bacterium]|nr:transposase [Candidatus Ozemobacteraceae bacterium]
MARLARLVISGVPHYITQRGNRAQEVFLRESDYRDYRSLMAEWCGRQKIEIWAYCLMPNHIHLIAVPPDPDALQNAIGEAHRRYTRLVNAREGWCGHLWQGRFGSFPMDDRSLLEAARSIELKPVRAGLARSPGEYPWSSAAAHLAGADDGLTVVKPLLSRVDSWGGFLRQKCDEESDTRFQRHANTGKPLGSDEFIRRLELQTGRQLFPKKPGRKRKETAD